MQDTYDAAEVRELLAVIRDLFQPPPALTYDGDAARQRLIAQRAVIIAAAVNPVAEGEARPRDALHIRSLANSPLPYEPMPEPGGSEGK